jgi:hypothetical protein
VGQTVGGSPDFRYGLTAVPRLEFSPLLAEAVVRLCSLIGECCLKYVWKEFKRKRGEVWLRSVRLGLQSRLLT